MEKEKLFKKYGIYQDIWSEFYMTRPYIPYIYIESEKKFIHYNNKENDAQILIFSNTFNGDISFIHHFKKIKVIIFGTKFNSSLDYLPESIELICFPYNSHFNLTVNNLNLNLKGIIFGKKFNKCTHLLPAGCESISRNTFQHSEEIHNYSEEIHFT